MAGLECHTYWEIHRRTWILGTMEANHDGLCPLVWRLKGVASSHNLCMQFHGSWCRTNPNEFFATEHVSHYTSTCGCHTWCIFFPLGQVWNLHQQLCTANSLSISCGHSWSNFIHCSLCKSHHCLDIQPFRQQHVCPSQNLPHSRK